MSPLVKHFGWWTREEVAADPNRVYLFGDNLAGYGNGGQAVIRGLPNALGVPTKKLPSMGKDAFFTDAEYEANREAIRAAFDRIPTGSTVVVSAHGLGTGLAELPERAPRTYMYLTTKLVQLTTH